MFLVYFSVTTNSMKRVSRPNELHVSIYVFLREKLKNGSSLFLRMAGTMYVLYASVALKKQLLFCFPLSTQEVCFSSLVFQQRAINYDLFLFDNCVIVQ